MKSALMIFFLSACLVGHAQIRSVPCPFDANQTFVLSIGVYGNHLETALIPIIESDIVGLPCHSYGALFIDSTKSFKVFYRELVSDQFIYKDTIVDPEKLKIEYLSIVCFQKAELPATGIPFFKLIDFPYLKTIEIELACDKLELRTWNNYETLIKNNSLETFIYEASYLDTELIYDLTPFRNLKILEIASMPSYELLSFMNLQRIRVETDYLDNVFPHQFIQLNQLNRDNNFDADIFAIRTFFWENLKLKPSTNEWTNYMSLSSINQIISENLPVEFINNGDVNILANDLRSYFNESWKIDTVANGRLKNGEMTGIWKYNVMTGNGLTEFYVNYSLIQQDIPENGNWEYRYFNNAVAISGRFRKGKKEGNWSFYKPNGDLQATKTFIHDKPAGLSITYFSDTYIHNPNHNCGDNIPVEVRRCFFSDNSLDFVEVKICSDSVFKWRSPHMRYDSLEEYFAVDQDGNMRVYIGNDLQRIIIQNSAEYNELLYEHFVKYLFPDIKLEDLNNSPFVKKKTD